MSVGSAPPCIILYYITLYYIILSWRLGSLGAQSQTSFQLFPFLSTSTSMAAVQRLTAAACQAGADICASNKCLCRLTSVFAYPVLCYITYVTCACVRPATAVCVTLQPCTQELLSEDLGLQDYCEFSSFSSVIPGTVRVLRYFTHYNFVAHPVQFPTTPV